MTDLVPEAQPQITHSKAQIRSSPSDLNLELNLDHHPQTRIEPKCSCEE